MAWNSTLGKSIFNVYKVSLVMVQPVLPDTGTKLVNSCCTEPPWACVPGTGSTGRLSTEASILPEVSSVSSVIIVSSRFVVCKLVSCQACLILGFEKIFLIA